MNYRIRVNFRSHIDYDINAESEDKARIEALRLAEAGDSEMAQALNNNSEVLSNLEVIGTTEVIMRKELCYHIVEKTTDESGTLMWVRGTYRDPEVAKREFSKIANATSNAIQVRIDNGELAGKYLDVDCASDDMLCECYEIWRYNEGCNHWSIELTIRQGEIV